MSWLRKIIVLAALMGFAVPAQACPLCKEAISASGDDDEVVMAPAAYNHSIYLMAGMPYALLSFFGYMIYRGCKQNEQALSEHRAAEETGTQSR